ncbi:unnamed protein product, partial [marine sediment metagenome]
MPTSSTSLPDEVEALRKIIAQQAEQISALEEYVRLLKHHRFGARSERASIDQLGLFNEAEAMVATEEITSEIEGRETAVAAHTRKKSGRKPLPDMLPRVEIVHDLPKDEKVCA